MPKSPYLLFLPDLSTQTYLHRHSASSSRHKGCKFGGWLVTEGWIKPSLFDGIINKDLLDGTQIQVFSVARGKYLSAENGGGSIIVANRSSPLAGNLHTMEGRLDPLPVPGFLKQFVGVNTGGKAVAVITQPGPLETFEIVRNTGDPNRVRIRASNGLFLQARTESSVTADFTGNSSWGNDDPSVFWMRNLGTMRGEYQVTNGYGPSRAPTVMRGGKDDPPPSSPFLVKIFTPKVETVMLLSQEHWQSFIVEQDFKFMKDKGLNTVRIPVGWWIASDPTPPPPFVGGSLAALDNAFSWADKYGLKVIINLHAAPGSQNGYEHSGTRDGRIEWGVAAGSVEKTVSVIEFLSQRYAGRPSLIAVELINEPRAEGVPFDKLKSYYQAGYDAVRRHTTTAYVIMSARLSADDTEFIPFASSLDGTVLDVHYYHVYSIMFLGWTAQQNINYVYKDRASQLAALTKSNGGLSLSLFFLYLTPFIIVVAVGEWVAEWNVIGATPDDYRRFAEAQQKVFNNASFGWAYWTYKNVNNHWSLQWMITNGYITLL
ncbi:unnamed protein product [Spirodela intermedia]|uniref:Uncharacterized protein n=1 Tax=Spirodela intermedia TaxID=51605 RepID=A0A7I8J4W6_SPIIN|nr:unnamed protein product [Spirodela intermedia]CAA6664430.1 unnamed protein product [Spirodela intermedia]